MDSPEMNEMKQQPTAAPTVGAVATPTTAEAPDFDHSDAQIPARKVGLPRFFEVLGRDLWSFYKASLLCVIAFLPGTVLVGFALMAQAPLLCLAGGLLAGGLGAPPLCGMIDTVLRSLRDEPGYWWHIYRRAWLQNWRASILPGLAFGLFVSGWSYMVHAQAMAGSTETAIWVITIVAVFLAVGFFSWLFSQIPLVDLPLPALLKNTALMFFGFFPRTLAASLVLCVYWIATLLYMPYTLFVILAFGFWLPTLVALMMLYPGLDKSFKLEETLRARREAETAQSLAAKQPVFDEQDKT